MIVAVAAAAAVAAAVVCVVCILMRRRRSRAGGKSLEMTIATPVETVMSAPLGSPRGERDEDSIQLSVPHQAPPAPPIEAPPKAADIEMASMGAARPAEPLVEKI